MNVYNRSLASIQYRSPVGSHPIPQLQSDSAIPSFGHSALERIYLASPVDIKGRLQRSLATRPPRGHPLLFAPPSCSSLILTFITCPSHPMYQWRPSLPFLPCSVPLIPLYRLIMPNNTPLASIFPHHLRSRPRVVQM